MKIQLCFTGINYILKYIKIETVINNINNVINNISQNYRVFFCIFNQINTALMSIRNFIKYIKNLTDPKLLILICFCFC